MRSSSASVRHTSSPTRVHLARIAIASAAVLALSGGLLVDAPGAGAAPIAVTTTTDGGAGSLRDAISQANASPGSDVISVPPGTYTLTIAGANEDNDASGDLDIKGDVTIVGTGGAAVTTIDGAGLDRVVNVISGNVTLQGLTITAGNSGTGTTVGGGIRHESGTLQVLDSVVTGNHAWSGAGIVSYGGTLDVQRSEIVANVATSEPGNGAVGGGIEKANQSGVLTIRDSLIANNQSVGGNAGALYSTAATNLIVNTTITGNSQYTNTVLFEKYSNSTGTADLQFVTIANNDSGTGPNGGIMANVIAPSTLALTLEGVLLQGNKASGGTHNCAVQHVGTITSAGHNLADDATCPTFTQAGDLTSNTATVLGALAANGGPTRTLGLQAGSSAIDAATCAAGVVTDQRGYARPAGASCDIGAFEAGAQAPVTTTTTTTAPTTTTTSAPTTTTTAPTTTTTQDPTTTTTADPTQDANDTPNTISGYQGTIYTYQPTVGGVTVVRSTLPATGADDTVRYGLFALALILAGAACMLGSRHVAGRRLAEHFEAQRAED